MNRTALVGMAAVLLAVPALVAACGGGDDSSEEALPPIATTTTTTVIVTTTTFVSTFYEVQSGDTLGAIAASFGVSIDELMTANGITNPDLVQAGQRLQIPPSTVLVNTLPGAPTSPPPPTDLAPAIAPPATTAAAAP